MLARLVSCILLTLLVCPGQHFRISRTKSKMMKATRRQAGVLLAAQPQKYDLCTSKEGAVYTSKCKLCPKDDCNCYRYRVNKIQSPEEGVRCRIGKRKILKNLVTRSKDIVCIRTDRVTFRTKPQYCRISDEISAAAAPLTAEVTPTYPPYEDDAHKCVDQTKESCISSQLNRVIIRERVLSEWWCQYAHSRGEISYPKCCGWFWPRSWLDGTRLTVRVEKDSQNNFYGFPIRVVESGMGLKLYHGSKGKSCPGDGEKFNTHTGMWLATAGIARIYATKPDRNDKGDSGQEDSVICEYKVLPGSTLIGMTDIGAKTFFYSNHELEQKFVKPEQLTNQNEVDCQELVCHKCVQSKLCVWAGVLGCLPGGLVDGTVTRISPDDCFSTPGEKLEWAFRGTTSPTRLSDPKVDEVITRHFCSYAKLTKEMHGYYALPMPIAKKEHDTFHAEVFFCDPQQALQFEKKYSEEEIRGIIENLENENNGCNNVEGCKPQVVPAAVEAELVKVNTAVDGTKKVEATAAVQDAALPPNANKEVVKNPAKTGNE